MIITIFERKTIHALMDKLTPISGTLFLVADMFTLTTLVLPDWIVTEVGCDTRLVTSHWQPTLCSAPRCLAPGPGLRHARHPRRHRHHRPHHPLGVAEVQRDARQVDGLHWGDLLLPGRCHLLPG